MKTLLSACACTILLLAGPAQAGLFGKEKNSPNDTDPNAVLTVADFVKVSGKGKLTGVTQVAIPNFFVQFVSDQTLELKGRLGANSYTTQVRGIDNATLQTIADALYDGFAEELKAAGIEVIATETLEATKDFADIRKAARVSPYTEESSTGGGKRDEKHQGVSTLVSARNLPINVRNTIDDYWLTPDASDGYKVLLVTAPMKVSQELKVPMLDVRLTVAFAAIKGSVSNSGGGSYQVGAATATNASTTSFNFDADLFPALSMAAIWSRSLPPRAVPFIHSPSPSSSRIWNTPRRKPVAEAHAVPACWAPSSEPWAVRPKWMPMPISTSRPRTSAPK